MPMPVRNLMRTINRTKILEIIRTAEMMSRIDIARATGLSQASITGITADLIREGLITEKQAGDYEGGRRPMLLALNPEGSYVVGVNLSISEISVVIVNFIADVVASHTEPLEPVHHSPEDIADRIARAVQVCIWEANFAKDQISGVGIGIPGLVDKATGVIRFLPNYGWENVNLKDLVQTRLNHSCYIDNSSNTLALAEQWFGAGRGIDNFLVVTIENGVGLGAIINGRLYRGFEGTAGEFGHLTVNPEGPPCRCGKKGCVEAYIGKVYILQTARQMAQDGEWTCEDPDELTYGHVLKMAQNGHQTLREIFETAGRMMGLGVSHLINLFNPVKIIITGQGVRAGHMVFNAMEKSLDAQLSRKFGRRATQVIVQHWREEDWARGAGTLVLQERYRPPVGQDTAEQNKMTKAPEPAGRT